MSMIIIELCEITLQEPVLLLEDAAASCYLAKRHASFSGNLALWLAKEDITRKKPSLNDILKFRFRKEIIKQKSHLCLITYLRNDPDYLIGSIPCFLLSIYRHILVFSIYSIHIGKSTIHFFIRQAQSADEKRQKK